MVMVTAEILYEKAKQLDSNSLQEVADFLDFVAHKRQSDFEKLLDKKRQYFSETSLEVPDKKPTFTTRTLTLEEMDAAIDDEVGLHK